MAAKWGGYTWEAFIEMEGPVQSRLVATYETVMQIEAVTSMDAQKEANRKAGKGRRHGT